MQNAQRIMPDTPAECVADADITTAIETLLATKKGLSAHEITVQTRAEIVELAGFTNSLLSQQRAEEIALAVRGVRGLHRTLAVRTAGVPDAQLQHATNSHPVPLW
ncbi:osmotically-inducible protein OsmY [Hymenobacter sp. UYAg731]